MAPPSSLLAKRRHGAELVIGPHFARIRWRFCPTGACRAGVVARRQRLWPFWISNYGIPTANRDARMSDRSAASFGRARRWTGSRRGRDEFLSQIAVAHSSGCAWITRVGPQTPRVPSFSRWGIATAMAGRPMRTVTRLRSTATVAGLCPGRLVPHCFQIVEATATAAWQLLLEDLTDSHFIATEWPLPPTVQQCELIVRALARFHAAWWDNPRLGVLGGTLARYLLRLTGRFASLRWKCLRGSWIASARSCLPSGVISTKDCLIRRPACSRAMIRGAT